MKKKKRLKLKEKGNILMEIKTAKKKKLRQRKIKGQKT